MNLSYRELSEKAYNLHTNKQLDLAEKIYISLLKTKPDDVNILNLYGLLLISKGDYKKAITYLTRAMIIKKSAYVISNLAKAYHLNNEQDRAIKLYNQALSFGQNDDIYYSLAIAYKSIGNKEEVIKNYKKAVELNPDNFKALYNLALAYKNDNDSDNAIMYAEMAIKVNENDEDTHALLSKCYEEREYYSQAIKELEKSAALNPGNYVYYYNLGVLYTKINDVTKAEENYKKSLLLNEAHVETYVNLASLYRKNSKERSLAYLLKAYSLKPDEPNVCLGLAQIYRDMYDNEKSIKILNELLLKNDKIADIYAQMAMNYMDLGEYESALTNYEKAINLDPENINYVHGKAVNLKYLGEYEKSKKMLEEIVKNDKTQIQSCITLGMMYLQEKNFEKGMELYRLRSNESKFAELFHNRIWEKNIQIENKNILVFSDCGLGDTFMCARYLNMLKEKAKSLTLQTDNEILTLLKNNFPDINIIPKSQKIDDYDVVIPIMDVPYALNMDLYNIPFSNGYLNADEQLINKFSKLDIFKSEKKKIGLFYKGNRKIFKNRSINFNEFVDLLKADNCVFYSFQIDDNLKESDNVINLKKYIKDYNDTVALLKTIDLLITIDSSIVHAAGALGVKTLLLLPKTAEWRWFNDEYTTPWYESVKIYKQKISKDWSEPINRLKKELVNL